MKDCKSQDDRAEVAQALNTLGPSDGFLFFCSGESFLRVQRLSDGGFKIEAPTNELLPASQWIDVTAVDHLRAAHFTLPRGEEAYFQCTRDLDEREIPGFLEELSALLREVYGAAKDAALQWFPSRFDCEHPSSAHCLNELQSYRETPDAAGWDRLCAAFLDAQFLLALAPASTDAPSTPTLRAVTASDGRVAAVVFSSQLALRRAGARGMAYARTRGSEAVLLARANGFAALVLDPSGPVPIQFTGEILEQLTAAARAHQVAP